MIIPRADGEAKTLLVCGKSGITISVNDNTSPCTTDDWHDCPLSKEK